MKTFKSFTEDVDIAQKKRVVIDMDEAESGPTRMEIQKRYDQLRLGGGTHRSCIDQLEKEFKINSIGISLKGTITNYEFNGKQITEADGLERAQKELKDKEVEFKKSQDGDLDRAKEDDFKQKQADQAKEFQAKEAEAKKKREEKYREDETKRADQERQKAANKPAEKAAPTTESVDDEFASLEEDY